MATLDSKSRPSFGSMCRKRPLSEALEQHGANKRHTCGLEGNSNNLPLLNVTNEAWAKRLCRQYVRSLQAPVVIYYCGDLHPEHKFPHGNGRLITRGFIAIGEWRTGFLYGSGVIYLPDKEMYQGRFVRNMRHGYGVHQYPKAIRRYEGEWRNGFRHGQGSMFEFYPKYQCYHGQWRKGKSHGIGIYSNADWVYFGEWNDHQKCGVGTQVSDHWCYHGEFKHNKRSGFGTMLNLPNTSRDSKAGQSFNTLYVGEWLNDRRYARGVQYRLDPNRYELFSGTIQDQKFHGPDIQHWVCKNGKWYLRYQGEYAHGSPHGFGVFIFDQSLSGLPHCIYGGNFVHGKPQGYGEMRKFDAHNNSKVYRGFVNTNPQGEIELAGDGTFTCSQSKAMWLMQNGRVVQKVL